MNVTGQVTYPIFSAPFPPGTPSNQQAAVTAAANAFKDNLKIGYAESFSFGIQRELTSNMVFEIRYVGTRSHKLWRQYNLNEVNTIENGFGAEFRLAQQNLIANLAAGRGSNFRYFGPGTGTFSAANLSGQFQRALPRQIPRTVPT